MNKEEILERSRKENKDLDLAELEIKHKSERLAGLVALALCFSFFVIEKIVSDRYAYGYFCIFSLYAAVDCAYKAVKMRGTADTVAAVCWSATAAIELFLFFKDLLETATR